MFQAMLDMALDQQRAFAEEASRAWQRLFALPRASELAREVEVGTTPHDVVLEAGTLRLLRYRRGSPAAYREPVLVCYALVNRPYILDLQADRSVVRRLLNRGFEVYLIDWGVPTAADRGRTLDDYVRGQLKEAADYVIARSTAPRLNLLGYCMGGTMSAMFTSVYPELVKSLTLMAAPIDFGGDVGGLLQLWTDANYFDVDGLIEAFGNCPPEFLQGAFGMMKPVQNYYLKYAGYFEKLDDERFVENYFAMERWTNDNIPVAGATFREFVKCLYQRNELVKGEFRLGDRAVDLGRITCPLLLLMASADHLVPPGQTAGIAPHVGSEEIKQMTLRAGHVGLAVSSKAHSQFWPEATTWIAEHSTPAPPSD